MAASEKKLSMQLQAQPSTSDVTSSLRTSVLPHDVVEAVNNSNDIIPALFALPCESGNTKKLKLCKRVGWLRDGVFTTGFMEIGVKEATKKKIFNQARRVTLMQKEDSVFQTKVIQGQKAPSCEQLNSLMVKPGTSTTGLINARGEIIPKKIMVNMEKVRTTDDCPGKLVVLSNKTLAQVTSNNKAPAVIPSPILTNNTPEVTSRRQIITSPPNRDMRITPKRKYGTGKSADKETTASCPAVEASKKLKPSVRITRAKMKEGTFTPSQYEPVHRAKYGRVGLRTSTSDLIVSNVSPSTTSVKPGIKKIHKRLSGAKTDHISSSESDIQQLHSLSNPKLDICKLNIDFSRHNVLQMEGLIKSPTISTPKIFSFVEASLDYSNSRIISKSSEISLNATQLNTSVSDRNTGKPLKRPDSDHGMTSVPQEPALSSSKRATEVFQSTEKQGQYSLRKRKLKETSFEPKDDRPSSESKSAYFPTSMMCCGQPLILNSKGLGIKAPYTPNTQDYCIEASSGRNKLISKMVHTTPESTPKATFPNNCSSQDTSIAVSPKSKRDASRIVHIILDNTRKTNFPNVHSKQDAETSAVSNKDSLNIVAKATSSNSHSTQNTTIGALPDNKNDSTNVQNTQVNKPETMSPDVCSKQAARFEASSDSNKDASTNVQITKDSGPKVTFVHSLCTQDVDILPLCNDNINISSNILTTKYHGTVVVPTSIAAPLPTDHCSQNTAKQSMFPMGLKRTSSVAKLTPVDSSTSLNLDSEMRMENQSGRNKSVQCTSTTTDPDTGNQIYREQFTGQRNPSHAADKTVLCSSSVNQVENVSDGYPMLQINSVYSLSEEEANRLFPKPSPAKISKFVEIKHVPVNTYSKELKTADISNGDLVVGSIENSTVALKGPVDTSRDLQKNQLQTFSVSLPVFPQQNQIIQTLPSANDSEFKSHNIGNPENQISSMAGTSQQTRTSLSSVVKAPASICVMERPSQQTPTGVNGPNYFPATFPANPNQPLLVSLQPIQMTAAQNTTPNPICVSPSLIQNIQIRDTPSRSQLYCNAPPISNHTLSSTSKNRVILNLPIVPQSPGNTRILITNVSKIGPPVLRYLPLASVTASMTASVVTNMTASVTTSMETSVTARVTQSCTTSITNVMSKVISAINSSESLRSTVVPSAGIVTRHLSSLAPVSNSTLFGKKHVATGTKPIEEHTRPKIPISSQLKNIPASELLKTFLITTSGGKKRLVSIPTHAVAAEVLSQMASTKAYQLVVPKPLKDTIPEEKQQTVVTDNKPRESSKLTTISHNGYDAQSDMQKIPHEPKHKRFPSPSTSRYDARLLQSPPSNVNQEGCSRLVPSIFSRVVSTPSQPFSVNLEGKQPSQSSNLRQGRSTTSRPSVVNLRRCTSSRVSNFDQDDGLPSPPPLNVNQEDSKPSPTSNIKHEGSLPSPTLNVNKTESTQSPKLNNSQEGCIPPPPSSVSREGSLPPPTCTCNINQERSTQSPQLNVKQDSRLPSLSLNFNQESCTPPPSIINQEIRIPSTSIIIQEGSTPSPLSTPSVVNRSREGSTPPPPSIVNQEGSKPPPSLGVNPEGSTHPSQVYLNRACRPPSPPSYINREDRVKQLKEVMKEKEKALEYILKQRQLEIEKKLLDPELFDL